MDDTEMPKLTEECPHCATTFEVSQYMPFEEVACPECGQVLRVRVVFDHYEIERMRGVGGMSQVFVARDSHLNRAVALKVLNRQNSAREDRIRQFEREARLTASISHPNVVKVYGVGHDQGNFYIAMELVDGASLEEMLRTESSMSEVQVLDLALQATEGLAAAYRVGLIHRDIKPGNILLTAEGKAKLVDFGLALVFERDKDESDEIWATPYYVPPEKLAGGSEDFRSDIYSLGSTFFHLLAGRPPYDTATSSIDELLEIKSRAVKLGAFAPMISEPTQKLVNRMIELRPEDRFQSYEELLAALNSARQDLLASLGLIQQATTRQSRREDKRRRALRMGAVGVLCALGVVGLVVWHATTRGSAENGGGPVADAGGGEDGFGADALDSNNTGERFLKARQMLVDGKLAEARAAFLDIYNDQRTRQPTVNWAAYNVALADLLADKPGEARDIMRRMKDSPRFQHGRGAQYGPLFLLTAEKILNSWPVPVDKLEEMKSQRGWETQALLVGLKNWQHGRFADAVVFLDAARKSKAPQEYEWIKELDPVLARYALDATTLAGIDMSDDFTHSEQVDSALASLRTTLAQLRTEGRAKRWVEGRIAMLGQLRGKLAAAEQKSAAEALSKKTSEEQEELIELEARLGTYRAGYRFEEALNEIRGLQLTTAAALKRRDQLQWLYQAAVDFFSVLAEDLNARPYKGAFQPREGAIVYQNVTITKATRYSFVVSGSVGVLTVPLAQVGAGQLTSLATAMLERTTDSPQTNRRRGLLACFNLLAGQSDVAARWADAVEQDKEFAEMWKQIAGSNGAAKQP